MKRKSTLLLYYVKWQGTPHPPTINGEIAPPLLENTKLTDQLRESRISTKTTFRM